METLKSLYQKFQKTHAKTCQGDKKLVKIREDIAA